MGRIWSVCLDPLAFLHGLQVTLKQRIQAVSWWLECRIGQILVLHGEKPPSAYILASVTALILTPVVIRDLSKA